MLVAFAFFFFVFKHSWEGYKEFKGANSQRKGEIQRMWVFYTIITVVFSVGFIKDNLL
jgi:hypothetical protein